MSRFRLFGVLFGVMFVLLGVVSSVASALELPENLPKAPVGGRSLTGDSIGAPELVKLNGNRLKCAGVTSEALEESSDPPKGTIHIHFTGCKGTIGGVTQACNSLKDTTEVILWLGTWQLVIDAISPELKAAIWFLLEEVHVECGLNLLKLKGDILCLHLNPTVKSKDHEFHCTQRATGDPEEEEFWNDAGEKKKITQLLCSEFDGSFESCAWVALWNILSSEEVEGMI